LLGLPAQTHLALPGLGGLLLSLELLGALAAAVDLGAALEGLGALISKAGEDLLVLGRASRVQFLGVLGLDVGHGHLDEVGQLRQLRTELGGLFSRCQ